MKKITLGVIALALALTGCTATAVHTAPAEPVKPVQLPLPPALIETHTFAAVGDSITAWIDRDNVPVPTTWATYAQADDLTLTGGWAKGGAKLAEMQANTVPVTADVLVIMAGTNDLGARWGTPIPQRLASLSAIVNQSAAPRVILSAVPPLDMAPAWAIEWNSTLQRYAALQGWDFVDPWSAFRTADGHYLPGDTIEGIHPIPAVQAQVGQIMHDTIMGLL